jgi:MFS family permease
VRRLLRTFFPPLPRSVATLQVGGLVNAFGNGVVYPFLFIYLHNVRGIGLAVAGLILAVHAVTSIVAGPIFGSQIDRFGGKVTLAIALGILSVGYAGYVFVHEPWQGFVVAAVSGVGVGGFWPAQSTLIAGLTPAEQRPAAFAMQRIVISGGIGLGALTGGLIATADSPGSFELLFLLDAVSFLVYMAVMLALVPEPDLRDATEGAAGRSGSYRQVLAHRAFVAVIALNALFILAGFSGFDVLPVYAKNEAGVSEAQIGLLFLVNTIVIVLAQAPIARLARGHRRMATLALLGVVWATGWLLVPLAGLGPASAMLLLTATMVCFALGQCLHGAVAAPLVADLAPPRLLGRYMALNALSWQVGFALGPAIGGFGLSISPAGVWVVFAALCLAGTALAFAIEGALPDGVRRTPEPTPASA